MYILHCILYPPLSISNKIIKKILPDTCAIILSSKIIQQNYCSNVK